MKQSLSKNEVAVYLTLLKIGSTKVTEISEKSKVPRTFVYDILNALIKKGLVSYVIKSGVRYYEAANPLRLKDILKEKEDKIDVILPELETIQKFIKNKPSVELYAGKEGIKTILEGMIKMPVGSSYCVYGNAQIFNLLTFYFPHYVKRRAERKIFARVIQEDVEFLRRAKKRDKEECREMRFLPIRFKSYVFIYEDKIALITTEEDEPIGILIQNKDLAETQKQVFEVLWNLAKPT